MAFLPYSCLLQFAAVVYCDEIVCVCAIEEWYWMGGFAHAANCSRELLRFAMRELTPSVSDIHNSRYISVRFDVTMELYFVEMLGISGVSLLFSIYLFLTKQKDYTMRFLSVYFCLFFAVTAVIEHSLKDPSIFMMIAKCAFPLLIVLLYPLLAKHKLNHKEIRLLIFVSAIGIVPFFMEGLTVLAFAFFGKQYVTVIC